MTPSRDAISRLIRSSAYALWAVDHKIDAGKVEAEWRGERRPTAGSAYARAIIDLIRAHPETPLGQPDLMSFWRSQGFFMAWGIDNGTFTPEGMVQKAKALGAEWVAVQDNVANRRSRDAIKAACRKHGIKLVVWRWSGSVDGSIEAINYWTPDAWVENVEHYTYDGLLPVALRNKYPLLPMGVITNFTGTGATREGTYDPDDSAPWINADFALIPECYMVNEQGAQPTLAPEAQKWTAATHLSWPIDRVFPCFGLYRVTEGYRHLWAPIWPERQPGLAFYAQEILKHPYHSFYVLENVA